MRILIVDDEAFLREELRDSLERVAPSNEYSEADNYDSAVKLLGENSFDIAFLDIHLQGKSGLDIAENAKRISPQTNLIMVTAYSEYALEAFRLFVSGYILKPFTDDDLRAVLNNLRNPVVQEKKDCIEIQCFGSFEAFAGGKPMKFKRSKEKELLAYLISIKGASASRNKICANIFEESVAPEKAVTSFKQVFASLKKDLARYGFEEIIIHSSNAYSIDVSLVNCDYYDYITGKEDAAKSYNGEFMSQYSWAEKYIYALENYDEGSKAL